MFLNFSSSDAMDREYLLAFEELPYKESSRTFSFDVPPSRTVQACRRLFGELELQSVGS